MRTMSLADRIKALRDRAGMSSSELAVKAGLSKGYLSQIEGGEANNPTIDKVKRLAEALGTDAAYLMEETSEPTSKPPELPAGLKEYAEQCAREGDPLDDSDLHMLLSIKNRGRRPEKATDWAYIHETIRRIIP